MRVEDVLKGHGVETKGSLDSPFAIINQKYFTSKVELINNNSFILYTSPNSFIITEGSYFSSLSKYEFDEKTNKINHLSSVNIGYDKVKSFYFGKEYIYIWSYNSGKLMRVSYDFTNIELDFIPKEQTFNSTNISASVSENNNKIYIANHNNYVIKVFTLEGEFLEEINVGNIMYQINSDILVEDNILYFATYTKIYRYDLITKEVIQEYTYQTTGDGPRIQTLKLSGNKLIALKHDVNSIPIVIYEKNDLEMFSGVSPGWIGTSDCIIHKNYLIVLAGGLYIIDCMTSTILYEQDTASLVSAITNTVRLTSRPAHNEFSLSGKTINLLFQGESPKGTSKMLIKLYLK